MSRIYFGYVVRNEGTGNQQVIPLIAASEKGLYAQARMFGLRLRGEDFVCSYEELQEFDEETIYELEGDE